MRNAARERLLSAGGNIKGITFNGAFWRGDGRKAFEAGILTTENEDIRSLRELTIYGLKGRLLKNRLITKPVFLLQNILTNLRIE